MLYTTLNAIKSHQPCSYGWREILTSLGKTKADDARLSLLRIYKSNGLDDALWCLRAVDAVDGFEHRYALDCARSVEHMSTDPRVKVCNDVTERFLAGRATKEELAAATAAATAAARDAKAAAFNATAAAKAAAWTAWAAACAAAKAAAWDTALSAAVAAWDAAASDGDAEDTVWDALGKHFVACLKAWPNKPWPKMAVIAADWRREKP